MAKARVYKHECDECEVEFESTSSTSYFCTKCEANRVHCFNCEEDITDDHEHDPYTDRWDEPVCESCYWEEEESKCDDCGEYPDDCFCCPECGNTDSDNDSCDYCCNSELGKKKW